MSVIISIYDDILHKFKKRALTSIPVGDHRIFNQHWPDWLANLGEDGRKLLAEDLKTVSKHGGAIIANNMLEMFRIRDEEQKGDKDGQVGLPIDDSGSERGCDSTLSSMGDSGDQPSNSDAIGSSEDAVRVSVDFNASPD